VTESEEFDYRLITFPHGSLIRAVDTMKCAIMDRNFHIYCIMPPASHPIKLRTQAIWAPGSEILSADPDPILSLPTMVWEGHFTDFYSGGHFAVREIRVHGNALQSRYPRLPNLNYNGSLCFGSGAGIKPDLRAAYHAFWNAPFFLEFSSGRDQHPRDYRSRSYFLPNPEHTCSLDSTTCKCLESWFREVATPLLADYPSSDARGGWQTWDRLLKFTAPVPDAELLVKTPCYDSCKTLYTDHLQKNIEMEWVVKIGEEEIYQSLENGDRYRLVDWRMRKLERVPPVLTPTQLVLDATNATDSVLVAARSTSRAPKKPRAKTDRGREKTRANVRRRPPRTNVRGDIVK